MIARLILVLVLAWPLLGAWGNGYSYRRTVTIDHTKCGSADSSGFPMLFSGTYSYLAHTDHSGNVTNANGYDIIFTSDASGSTQLNHEIESYNHETGAVVFWVRIPTLAYASDTVIYLWYGKNSISTSQENKTGVWDANYKAVWHLGESSGTTVSDSTSNSLTGTKDGSSTPAATTSGKIGSAQLFATDGNDDISFTEQNLGSSQTIEMWVKWASGTYHQDKVFTSTTDGGSFLEIKYNEATNNGVTWDAGWSGLATANNPVSPDTWQYWTVQRSGASVSIKLNGVEQASRSDFDTRSFYADKVSGMGTLDEVRLSNTSRSDSYVTASYNSQNSPSTFYAVGTADAGSSRRKMSIVWQNAKPSFGQGSIDDLIGPVLSMGSSPWGFYDAVEPAVADALEPYQTTLPTCFSSPLAGTATLTGSEGAWVLVGSGTSWASQLSVGNQIYIRWDYTSGGYAYLSYYVNEVTDNTHITLNQYYFLPPHDGTFTVIKCDDSCLFWNGTGSAATSNNFYDAVAGLYRLWKRTNNTDYRDQARSLCDNWVRINGFGRAIQSPRDAGYEGIAMCAMDTGTLAYWDHLTYQLEYSSKGNPTSDITRTAWLGDWDKREQGYELRATAIVAQYHPDATVRAAYCTRLSNLLTHVWLLHQGVDGRFEEWLGYWNSTYPDSPIYGVYGTSPWRSIGLSSHALIRAYDACRVCNLTYLRLQSLNAITKAAQFWWDKGRTSADGTYYHVGSATITSADNPGKNFDGVVTHSQSVSWTSTSRTVTGTSTAFLTDLAVNEWITAPTDKTAWQVESIESNTSLTLKQPYTGSTRTETYYLRTVSAPTSCGPSSPGPCEIDLYDPDGRNDAVTIPAVFAWLYYTTGDTTWKTRYQRVSGATYGGPADGAGGGDACTGPYCTSYYGNFGAALPKCSENGNVPPCTVDYGTFVWRSKQWAMSTGAGRSDNGQAWVVLKDAQ